MIGGADTHASATSLSFVALRPAMAKLKLSLPAACFRARYSAMSLPLRTAGSRWRHSVSGQASGGATVATGQRMSSAGRGQTCAAEYARETGGPVDYDVVFPLLSHCRRSAGRSSRTLCWWVG
jgi:hypothetical protein